MTISVAAVSTAAAEKSANDLETIIQYWNGDFDNTAQIETLRADGRPVWQATKEDEDGPNFGGHLRVTAHYRSVELPGIGEHVLYVESTKHDDPDDVFRQRIYTLSEDKETGKVRVKLWYFKDREKYVGAWRDIDKIKDLSPDELSPLGDECDLIATREENGRYHMKMTRCVFGEKLFDYQVRLGPDSFWFRDRIANAETGIVTMTAGSFTYHKLERQ